MQVGMLPDQSPEVLHLWVALPLSSNPTSQLYVTTELKIVGRLGLVYITWPLGGIGAASQCTTEKNIISYMHYRVLAG